MDLRFVFLGHKFLLGVDEWYNHQRIFGRSRDRFSVFVAQSWHDGLQVCRGNMRQIVVALDVNFERGRPDLGEQCVHHVLRQSSTSAPIAPAAAPTFCFWAKSPKRIRQPINQDT